MAFLLVVSLSLSRQRFPQSRGAKLARLKVFSL